MYEIRNYHFEPSRLSEYRHWAQTLAVPHLKDNMDVIGFWITNDTDAEYGGRLPADTYGPAANITWVIRWKDRAQRDAAWATLRKSGKWKAIIGQVPGGRESYLRTESKFADAV